MKPKIKAVLIIISIGIIALPTFAIGGSFTVSLIQGKSIPEAIQILAEQIDSLIGRMEIVETKQSEQEEYIADLQSQLIKEEACRKTDEIFEEVRYVYSQGIHRVITGRIDEYISATQEMIEEYEKLIKSSVPQDPEDYETGEYEETKESVISRYNKAIQELENKLDKLQELKIEYLIQKELCGK